MKVDEVVNQSVKIGLPEQLPEPTQFEAGIRRAPDRGFRWQTSSRVMSDYLFPTTKP